jgi:hypothetical protein
MSHFSKGRWVQLAGAVLSLSLSATAWGAYSLTTAQLGTLGPMKPDGAVAPKGGQQLDLRGTGTAKDPISLYGYFNEAIFSVRDNDVDVTKVGTGVFDPFLRLQARGEEAGYNVDVDKLADFQFDEKAPSKDPTQENGTWTHSLTVGDLVESGSYVEFTDILDESDNSTWYFELMLDINEANGDKSLITLTDLQLFLGEPEQTASRSETKNGNFEDGLNYDETTHHMCVGSTNCNNPDKNAKALSLIYDLDFNTDPNKRDNSVLLDYDNMWGSGKGVDLFVYVPTVYFGITKPTELTQAEQTLLQKQLVLYSKFGNADCLKKNGDTTSNCDDALVEEQFLAVSEAGFEEWAIRGAAANGPDTPEDPNPVPAPAPLLLMGAGLLGAYITRRRRSAEGLS